MLRVRSSPAERSADNRTVAGSIPAGLRVELKFSIFMVLTIEKALSFTENAGV